MGIAEQLPPKHKKRVKSTMEMMVEKYSKIGQEQGREQGLDEAIKNIVIKRPDLPDAEVADLLGVTIERVQRIRATLAGLESN